MKGRKYTSQVKPGEKALLAGWVHETRDLGKMVFIVLRDREGLLQITAKKGVVRDDILEQAKKLRKEAVISVEGSVVENPKAPGGVELIPERIVVYATPQKEVPIDVTGKVKADIDTRLDYRYVDIKKPEVAAIFKIRSEVINAARDWFQSHGFYEVNCPRIIGTGSEGGAALFPLVYYGKEAFLIQSPQLHKQAATLSLERVYDIGPIWRAEKSHTTRHLAEFFGIDAEIAFIDKNELMDIQEALISYIYERVSEKCKRELELIDRKVEPPKRPFHRLDYREAIERVQEMGHQVEYGEDLPTPAERDLCKSMDRPFFIIDFPWSAGTAFYYATHPEDPERSQKIDLLLPGECGVEISSGGQREHDVDKLKERIVKAGLDPQKLGWYLHMYELGMPPHAGFGMGINRILRGMLQIERVQELVMFPRTPERLNP